MGCPGCGRSFHAECEIDNCEECHGGDEEKKVRSLSGGGKGAPIKDPEKVTDPLSTGRKRAAHLYPLFREQPCEWQGKKNCGGGIAPIVGCISGLQQHRHHGPVKLPIHNEPGNVHRICNRCHAVWHAMNDPIYDEEEYKNLPHTPEDATEMELLTFEANWKLRKLK